LIRILENFAAITPEAAWAGKILGRLKNYENEDDKEERSS